MANLTIAVEEGLLKAARSRAVSQGTSVNALLRDYLEAYAGVRDGRKKAAGELLDIAARAKSGSGNRRWTRDELHER